MHSTLEAALTAHVLWRMRIAAVLSSGNLATINRDEVARDDSCDLGRWIYGPGSVLSTYTEFQEFKECHKRFHASIGIIIDKIRAGNVAGAKQEMNSGYFSYCSQDIVAKIIALDTAINSD